MKSLALLPRALLMSGKIFICVTGEPCAAQEEEPLVVSDSEEALSVDGHAEEEEWFQDTCPDDETQQDTLTERYDEVLFAEEPERFAEGGEEPDVDPMPLFAEAGFRRRQEFQQTRWYNVSHVYLKHPVGACFTLMEEEDLLCMPEIDGAHRLLRVATTAYTILDQDLGSREVTGVECGTHWDLLYHWRDAHHVRFFFQVLFSPARPVGQVFRDRVGVTPFDFAMGSDGETPSAPDNAAFLWRSSLEEALIIKGENAPVIAPAPACLSAQKTASRRKRSSDQTLKPPLGHTFSKKNAGEGDDEDEPDEWQKARKMIKAFKTLMKNHPTFFIKKSTKGTKGGDGGAGETTSEDDSDGGGPGPTPGSKRRAPSGKPRGRSGASPANLTKGTTTGNQARGSAEPPDGVLKEKTWFVAGHPRGWAPSVIEGAVHSWVRFGKWWSLSRSARQATCNGCGEKILAKTFRGMTDTADPNRLYETVLFTRGDARYYHLDKACLASSAPLGTRKGLPPWEWLEGALQVEALPSEQESAWDRTRKIKIAESVFKDQLELAMFLLTKEKGERASSSSGS